MEPINSTESTLKNGKISRNTCDDSSNNSDIISNLPESILHYILSFLQTTDVVNTSILSRRWRYLWTSMPYLDFDLTPFLLSRENWCRNDSLSTTFKDFVNWVLIFQNGSTNIQRFRLASCNLCDGQTILRWVHVAARRNFQEFDLSYCPVTAFELPHCLVTCKTLVVLKLNLYKCVLELPSFPGFSRLKSLELVSVALLDEGLARSFFSSCPLLESLSLIKCVLTTLKVLDISATNLKNLTIDYIGLGSHSDDDGLCKTKLQVSCPNLVSFKYIDGVARDYSLQNLSSIENVFIHLIDGSEKTSFEEVGYLMCKVLDGLCNAKVLKLSIVFLEFLHPMLGRPECFTISFYNLKSLKLCVGVNGCYMQDIIHLLKYSPNLEALLIVFEETCEWNDYWQLHDENIACLTDHLKTVELIDAQGMENELEFVRFLLKNGHVLEKIIVTWAMYLGRPEDIIQKVLRFPKSSSNVALTFVVPKSQVDFFML